MVAPSLAAKVPYHGTTGTVVNPALVSGDITFATATLEQLPVKNASRQWSMCVDDAQLSRRNFVEDV